VNAEKISAQLKMFEDKYGTLTRCNVHVANTRATLMVAYQLALMNERKPDA